jgi:AraC family transcriptional regulator
MKAALQNYHGRMQRALDYIDRHLDGDLDLETVSRVAAFSKFHFHRQFTATFKLSVHRYVQLARMKRASHRLASKDAQSVTDIAMDAGYDAPEAFARAFRQRFGQSPSSFRKSPDWAWLMAFGPLDNARNTLMQIIFDHDDVTIRDVPPTPVAIMEHRGDRAMLEDTFQRFRAICIGTDQQIEANDAQMKAGVIPGGRCAVLRYPGNTTNLEPAALYLYRDWLPASGEEARDFPIYCQRRLSLIPELPAHEVVVELFLPLK